MNTRLGKSFGLAFVMAVGILAVMFALGAFNAPKAGADVVTVELELAPATLGTAGVTATVTINEGAAMTTDDSTFYTIAFSTGVDASGATVAGMATADNSALTISSVNASVTSVLIFLDTGQTVVAGDIIFTIGGLTNPGCGQWPVTATAILGGQDPPVTSNSVELATGFTGALTLTSNTIGEDVTAEIVYVGDCGIEPGGVVEFLFAPPTLTGGLDLSGAGAATTTVSSATTVTTAMAAASVAAAAAESVTIDGADVDVQAVEVTLPATLTAIPANEEITFSIGGIRNPASPAPITVYINEGSGPTGPSNAVLLEPLLGLTDMTRGMTGVTATITYAADAPTAAGSDVGFTFSDGMVVEGTLPATVAGMVATAAGNLAGVVTVTFPTDSDPDTGGNQDFEAGTLIVEISGITNAGSGGATVTVGGLTSNEVPLVGPPAVEPGSVMLALDPATPGADGVMATITYEARGVTDADSGVEFTFSSGMVVDGALTLTATVSGMSDAATPVPVTVDATADGTSGGGVVTVTFPADSDTNTAGVEGFAAGQLIVTISGIMNAVSGAATVTVGGDTSNMVPLVDPTVIPTEPDEAEADVTLEVSPETAGAAARVIVTIKTAPGFVDDLGTADVDESDGNDLEVIVIHMGSFGLPSTFDIDDVSLRGLGPVDADGDYEETMRGTPEDVEISGSEVTITVDDMDQSEDDHDFDGLSPHFKIIFERSAGITVPTTASDDGYTVKLVKVTNETPEDTDYDSESNPIMVEESLSIDPDDGPMGTEVTVTGKGFGSNITSLFVDTEVDDGEGNPNGTLENEEHKIATNIDVENGTFSYTFTIDSNFEEPIYIQVLKADGSSYEGDPVTFDITGMISLSTDSAQPGDEITVTLANFIEGDVTATIGKTVLMLSETAGGTGTEKVGDFNDSDLYTEIPVNLVVGKHQIKVMVDPDEDVADDEETGTADITIEGLPLTVSPTAAVPGQEITIKGSGFTPRAVIYEIKVGDVGFDRPGTDILVNSSGNFVANIDVPLTGDDGDDVLVEVRETDNTAETDDATYGAFGHGRQGVVRMTIPEATLTLNPATSRPDSTVVASGTGYVAGAVVEIKYDNTTVVSVNADGTGNWTKAFVVPTDTEVDGDYDVEALYDGDPTKSATETHTVPGGGLTVSPLVGRPGASISITGEGFTAYRPVSSITINSLAVLTGIVNTDANGDFATTILLPALPAGTHSMIVVIGGEVSGETETIVFTVSEAGPATLPSADAFADLIGMDNLIVVWNFDNTTKAWSFYDPRPAFAGAIDLTEVTSGDNVWIRITADQMFQGRALSAGWNLVTID